MKQVAVIAGGILLSAAIFKAIQYAGIDLLPVFGSVDINATNLRQATPQR